MKKLKDPVFLPVSEVGQKYLQTEFFKKTLKIKNDDLLSAEQKKHVFHKVKLYNAFYRTHFFVSYKPAGESTSFIVNEITGGIEPSEEKTFVEKIKETAQGIKTGIQQALWEFDNQKLRPGKKQFKDVRFTNH